ncbi:MAG TPA: 4Fe-4S dicluster domain-containing protein [Bryobacteraceae bacterium]|nr:4Fe-4S dicluster domain-containing protein [Bryobacteraceae bacterium]
MIILPECTGCLLCAAVCPNSAIELTADAMRILAPLCTECVGYAAEPSCAEVCPEDVIVQG